ncbi:predicted permeases [Lactiplantibacillus plantarum]|nr:predicted permeases [Lactiplantibacillus plantarum]
MDFVAVFSECRGAVSGSSRKELVQTKSDDITVWQYWIHYWVIDRGSDIAIIQS